MMKFVETTLDGLFQIEPDIKGDSRGSFWRTYCESELAKQGLDFGIVQANATITKQKGTVRGMHFQLAPKEEDKIVQCLAGSIYDVAIDLRKESSSYGKWFAVELNDKNHKLFFIPKGFAHGFQTLTDNCVVHYFMSESYAPDLATGVRWDDPQLKVDWPLPVSDMSDNDKNWPYLSIET